MNHSLKTSLKIWYLAYKGPILFTITVITVALLGILWALFHPTHSPVPSNIKKEAGFTIIYPTGYKIPASSWKYMPSQDSLAFNVQKNNYSAVFTEEQTPLAFQDDTAAYDRFIGSLKPAANFNTSLGSVSLANFVTSGDYQVVGLTGILNTHGTFILVHPNQELTDNQWRNIFNSLKVSD